MQHATGRPGIRPRSCTGCRHLTSVRTCKAPVAAGLLTPDEGFGIAWPPAGYGVDCKAFTPK
jgi:hypothetical protein